MAYIGTKLVYFKGKPQWLLPDGSFLPARDRKDGSVMMEALYLRDRTLDVLHPVRD